MRQSASVNDPCGDFPGLSAVPVLFGTYGVRAPSPRLEWMIGVIPMRMATGETISTVPCWRTCRLVRCNGTWRALIAASDGSVRPRMSERWT